MAWNMSKTKTGALVLDASSAVAIAAKEGSREVKARAAIANYSTSGYLLFAPNVIVSETLYALCNREQHSLLNPQDYVQSVNDFQALMAGVLPPPNGEASLILRAAQIRASYGCSRSADALYIALAEELSQTYTTRLLTFDQDLPKQAAQNAPTVNVHLLT
jgi:predicted nucleic acid-binding protein